MLFLFPLTAFAFEVSYEERLGLVATCVKNGKSQETYTVLCEYKSKKTQARSCAMARGSSYAFAVDCQLFDEVHPKK
jgi:hypothetical protein